MSRFVSGQDRCAVCARPLVRSRTETRDQCQIRGLASRCLFSQDAGRAFPGRAGVSATECTAVPLSEDTRSCETGLSEALPGRRVRAQEMADDGKGGAGLRSVRAARSCDRRRGSVRRGLPNIHGGAEGVWQLPFWALFRGSGFSWARRGSQVLLTPWCC